MFAIYLDSSYFFQLFFLEFLAILLDCSLFLSGWTGCPGSQPDPDPNISPTPEARPDSRTIVRLILTQAGQVQAVS